MRTRGREADPWLRTQARDLEETLASLSAALASPTTPFPALPSYSSPSHPATSHPDPSKSLPPPPPLDRPEPPSKEPTPTKAHVRRKPPPAVTASVIRQAGERAVQASGAGKGGRGAEEWAALGGANDWAELGKREGEGGGKEGEGEKTVEELLREEGRGEVDEMGRRGEGKPMTDTTRVKWDGAMREIEEALRM